MTPPPHPQPTSPVPEDGAHGDDHHHHEGCAGHGPNAKDLSNMAEERIRTLRWVLLLTIGYCGLEIFGSWYTNSLSLLADAGHMLADTAGVGLSLFAAWLSTRAASRQKTFGYYRVEILAAFLNGIFLVLLSLWILIEALQRLGNPEGILAPGMVAIAVGGFFVNLVALKLLHGHHSHLNMRAAYLHVLGDLLGSVSAILAGLSVWFLGWMWADSIAGIIIAALILVGAVRLLLESVDILLEACPSHIDADGVRESMVAHPGVSQVHSLHIWTITSGNYAMAAHVVVHPRDMLPTPTMNRDTILGDLQKLLKEKYHIDHVTLQLEGETFMEEFPHSMTGVMCPLSDEDGETPAL